jgi:hypothetical protein
MILTGAVNVLCITTYCALPIKLDLILLSLYLLLFDLTTLPLMF